MTEAKKYCELFKALGELLAKNNETIQWQEYQLDDLKKKLEEAENQIEELKKGNSNE